MKDWRGSEIRPGVTVAYAVRSGYVAELVTGTVETVEPLRVRIKGRSCGYGATGKLQALPEGKSVTVVDLPEPPAPDA